MNEKFEELKEMIINSPTPFHFVEYARTLLTTRGFIEVKECSIPEKIPEKGFFIRDERCISCWKDRGHNSGSIIASHIDSPCLQLKPIFKCDSVDYRRCSVSFYGSPTLNSWLGRSVKLCGKISIRNKEAKTIKTQLYDSKRAIGFVPFTSEDPLQPPIYVDSSLMVCTGTKSDTGLREFLAKELGVQGKDILDFDLRFVDVKEPSLFSGIIESEKLDDLVCTCSALRSFIEIDPEKGSTNMFVGFDNEEIGSSTHCGGMSDIINDTISIIINDKKKERVFKRKSLIASFDVNHATHPNFLDRTSPLEYTELGKGIAIATDDGCNNGDLSEILPIFSSINYFANPGTNSNGQRFIQNEIGGGSTIGKMTESRTGIKVMDIGQVLLSMHSIREMGSVNDLENCYRFCETFYSIPITNWF